MIKNRDELKKEISKQIKEVQETDESDMPSIKDEVLLKTQELVLNAMYMMLDDNDTIRSRSLRR